MLESQQTSRSSDLKVSQCDLFGAGEDFGGDKDCEYDLIALIHFSGRRFKVWSYLLDEIEEQNTLESPNLLCCSVCFDMWFIFDPYVELNYSNDTHRQGDVRNYHTPDVCIGETE